MTFMFQALCSPVMAADNSVKDMPLVPKEKTI